MAAPYAAVFGDGRIPLTLAMLTMVPPCSCALHHRVGQLRAHERRGQVERDDPGAEPRRHGGGVGRGCTAGVVDEHVEATVAFGDAVDERVDLVGVAHVGGHELDVRRERRSGACPAAHHDARAGVGEAFGDAAPDPAAAAGDEHDLAGEVERRSRLDAVDVAREDRRLADVARLDQAGHPTLPTDREPAVRRHAVLERLEVRLVRREVLARGVRAPRRSRRSGADAGHR